MLRSDFSYGDGASAPLVAFAQFPTDSRSACIAVLATNNEPRAVVEQSRPLGTPLVFVCHNDTLQWWKQGTVSAEWLGTVRGDQLAGFFERHQTEFSPEAIYRAKTLGRVRSEYQLRFVDVGLMPLVEEEVGQALSRLIAQSVTGLKERLGWTDVTGEQGHWLLKSVFWLVSGKILRDKGVPNFENLDLSDVGDVFGRLSKHYGTSMFRPGSKEQRAALQESAQRIDRFSSLALTTTESLAYVYENTLVSKETRASLGTHSTPSYLVDYILGHLADWIEEIPENRRRVFEPACGHAAFLVSAMRLLTQLLPPERAVPSRRRSYLRTRIHGTDRDAFALELARLSLTLTDIPNPDGWDLTPEDMFIGRRLADRAAQSTILLANPPFGNFTPEEQQFYANNKSEVRFVNKAAELIWRCLPAAPEGSLFGIIVPQTFLHSANAVHIRSFLARECELKEISLFPDKVFSFSDVESAIVVGRRKRPRGDVSVRYRRIRERQMTDFQCRYDASTTRTVRQSRFLQGEQCSLRLPDLDEVWQLLGSNPTLNSVAVLGQGLAYHGRFLPADSVTYSAEPFPGAVRGFVHFDRGLQLHAQPTAYWMNLKSEVIQHVRAGTATGVPQVLLNYAPASRGPWRLKALIDWTGHPVTSRFIAVRPKHRAHKLPVLWAILNSPIANAYAFAHLSKRDNIVGDIRRIPLPSTQEFYEIETAAGTYLDAVKRDVEPERLRHLMLEMDAAVLRAYALPAVIERIILDLFTGWRRVGVPFEQTQYFPPELHHAISLSEFLAYESDWPSANRRRGELIDKDIAGTVTDGERAELERLEAYADYYIDKVAPYSMQVLEELENRVLGSPASEGENA